MTSATFLERAVPLVDRFSVIPLQPQSKQPYPGLGVTQRSRDGVKLTEWAERYPDANVAICADENIVILESDDLGTLPTTGKARGG